MHLIVIRLLLDALETALSGSGRRSPVVALGATLWILSAAPLGVPEAMGAAGIDALRRAAPPPLPAMMPPGAGIPIWPWLLATVVVGAIWRGRARPRRRRLRRVGAELPLLAANWRRAAVRRRAFLRERARRRRRGACDGAR
jgi:hypothetical protein